MKEAKANSNEYVARFFYRNEIPFNITHSKRFKVMFEALGNYD